MKSKKMIIQKLALKGLFIMALLGLGFTGTTYAQTGTSWKVPSNADVIKNPLKTSSNSVTAGKKLYEQMCAICHGAKGKGDGVAGMALKPRPANFTKDTFQKQTDGAIYWKLTHGNPPMAAYKEILTDQQRWDLVNFLRTFGGKKK